MVSASHALGSACAVTGLCAGPVVVTCKRRHNPRFMPSIFGHLSSKLSSSSCLLILSRSCKMPESLWIRDAVQMTRSTCARFLCPSLNVGLSLSSAVQPKQSSLPLFLALRCAQCWPKRKISCAKHVAHSSQKKVRTRSWPTLAKPTLANPTLASLFCYRVWPIRLWPALVFLWYGRLWPKPTLAKTDFGQTDFGQTDFDFFLCVFWFHGFRVGVSKFSFGHVRCPRDRPSRDRRSQDRPSQDRPSRDRPSRDRPSRDRPSLDRLKFRSFFSLSRRKIRSFLPSLGVFSLNFGGVFEDRDPKMCTFGLSDCRVKPRRPHQTGPPGLAHDSPRTPNAHI